METLPVAQNNPTSLALQGLSKPTLAKLNEDYPKVKNIIIASDIEDLMNFLIRILNIKIASQDDQDNLDFQMPLILDFIKSKFGTLTIPEIKEAFKMYVAKEFPEIKVFRMLDCIVVGEILTAFVNFRNDSLRVYDDKKRVLLAEPEPTSEEEKKAIREEFLKSIFDDLKIRGYSQDIWMVWEKDFKTKELTEFANKVNATITNAEKREMYAVEEKLYLSNIKLEAQTSRMQSTKWVVENATQQIKNNLKINAVVNRCRCLTGSKYLKNYLTDFEEFKKQINDS